MDHDEALAHFAESLRGFVSVLEHSLDASKKIEELEDRIAELEQKIEDHEHEASDVTDLEDFVSDKTENQINEAVDSLTIQRG